MKSIRRAVTVVALMGAVALPLGVVADAGGGLSLVGSAHAQNFIKNLIARLRGETLPAGIVKSNGRIEATQVDVSSKYAGRLEEVTVEEGSNVAQGQVIARISSPEYEAQLRSAQANVQSAKDAAAAAEAEIASRQSALEFAKSDFERGAGADEERLHHQADLRPAQAQPRFGGRVGDELHRRSATRRSRRSRTPRRRSSGSSRSSRT